MYAGNSSPLSNIIALITILIVAASIFFAVKSAFGPMKNDIPRERLETGNAFDNNCIDDQIGWFDNINSTSKQLQKFWKETGVQPYIILKDDDGTLTTDAQKEAWTTAYYDENIDREDAFLYVYFYEQGEESTGVPGYMAYANGYEASSVMDSGAVEIFWNYLDRYWVTDMSMDAVIYTTFNKTGETIMHVSTTGKDIVKWAIIAVVVGIIGFVAVFSINKKFKDKRAKAEEDERILKATVEGIHKNAGDEDLVDKYLN